ncbi:MAG: flagellar FlbD family protein [Lachnospiraceae bacterium]|nr:flagellar FlbD family protein [Lachnospiraceae bacterium]
MVILTKLNGEPIGVNSGQIEYIESIPESKIIMMNGRYHIVKESQEEIVEKVVRYNQEIRKGTKVEA